MEFEKRTTITASAADGSQVSIPLQIVIRVGDDGAEAARDSSAGFGDGAADGPEQAISSAIAEARRNRNLTAAQYYDEAADAADRQAYYQTIDPAATPAALYQALSGLTAATHRTRLDYSPSTHLYPDVDLQPDGRIESIYSSRSLDPETLIRADADVDRARRSAMRALAESRALAAEDVAVYLNRIEAAFPYNCEHVVPQSWFAKRLPMKGDLHHLFACEIKCNELRANIPYFDFTPDDVRRPDCGRADPGRFEPVGGKGAVARATLYFLLRYPKEIDNNEREYTRERLGVLLQWHHDHAVSLHERHRNRAIQRKQGNRNPLVDHPEWAAHIDWSKGLR